MRTLQGYFGVVGRFAENVADNRVAAAVGRTTEPRSAPPPICPTCIPFRFALREHSVFPIVGYYYRCWSKSKPLTCAR